MAAKKKSSRKRKTASAGSVKTSGMYKAGKLFGRTVYAHRKKG